MKKHVVVTGGSGKAGRACATDLVEHGYAVTNIDAASPSYGFCTYVAADLTDLKQCRDALSCAREANGIIDAVVHLAAAIPSPTMADVGTFSINITSTYNVFETCRQMRIYDVVWASSETLLGIPYDVPPPYFPVDEEYPPRTHSAYSLAKLLSEEMARQFVHWDPAFKIIGLRFSNIMEPADYAKFPSFEDDLKIRRGNLWGYIDSRDAAQAIRKAIEFSGRGADLFVIANADTVQSTPSADLIAQFFPGVPLKRPLEKNETILSNEKASRVLGYMPQYTWREILSAVAG